MGSGVVGGAKAAGSGVVSGMKWAGGGLRAVGGNEYVQQFAVATAVAAIGCGTGVVTSLAIAYAFTGPGAAVAMHPYALAGECAIGATIETFKFVNPSSGPGLDAVDMGLDAYDILMRL